MPPKPKRTLTSRPFSIVAYGPSGVGKTSFAANIPGVGFVCDPQEEGALDLMEYGLIPKVPILAEPDDWESLLAVCSKIAANKFPVKAVAFDSLTGLEKLCFVHHCEEYFDGDWSSKGFYSYQQGPKNAAKRDWPMFLDAMEDIRRAGISVMLLAHSQVKPYSNPEGPDYDRYSPYLDKEIWQLTSRWAQAVLFLNYYVDLEKKGPKTKANPESEQRFIHPVWSPAYDAKNRYGIQDVIEMGEDGKTAYSNFAEALRAAKDK